GPLKNYVLNSAKVFSNILYLGSLNKEDISLELKKANALIFPSTCLEPFGLVIIEAFINGCAVLSTNIGVAEVLIEDCKNGFHFKTNDEKDLISVLQKWESLELQQKTAMREWAFKTFIEKYSPVKQDYYFSKIYSDTR